MTIGKRKAKRRAKRGVNKMLIEVIIVVNKHYTPKVFFISFFLVFIFIFSLRKRKENSWKDCSHIKVDNKLPTDNIYGSLSEDNISASRTKTNSQKSK